MARNKDSKKKGARKGKTYREKMAMAAGSLSALYLLPSVAGAAPVLVTGSPVQLAFNTPSGTTVTWDVDGADGHDFELVKDPDGFGTATGSIHFASRTAGYASLNGRGLVAPFFTDNVQALQRSFRVGPTLANNYTWGAAPYRYRNAMQGTVGNSPYSIGYDFNYGFAPGDNFIGFRFLDGNGDLHYGWATINFDVTNGLVTISQWAYESDPDTAIHIADPLTAVPEPATSTLMLLGLGAAGLLAWRRRKQAQAADSDAV